MNQTKDLSEKINLYHKEPIKGIAVIITVNLYRKTAHIYHMEIAV